jgi:hypothetical protein
MNKIFLCCLAGMLLLACQADIKEAEAPVPKARADQLPTLRKVVYSWEDTVRHYKMKATYPALLNNLPFGALVSQKMEENKSRFEAFIADFGETNNILTSDFELVQFTDTIISIRQVYEWAVPGTSVLQYRFGHINFQPATAEVITLESLFRKDVEYKQLLTRKLQERIAGDYQLAEVEITDEDLGTYIIGEDYLQFDKVLYPALMQPEPVSIRIPFADIRKQLLW